MRTDYRTGESHANKHIAVIGSGVAGLSAAWLLASRHRVTLYEAEARLGGHSNTVLAPTGPTMTPVDTGFIVFNEKNYPNLTAMLEHLGVDTVATNMSFSASLDDGRLEYGSSSLRAMMGADNAVSWRFWQMLRDIYLFYSRAPGILHRPQYAGMSLGRFLDQQGYSEAFIEDHLLPMGAAIWSTTAAQMREYPLYAFVRFFMCHGLLDIITARRPIWRTVKGGSTNYVRKLAESIGDVRVATGAVQVLRERGGVTVIDAQGQRQWFTDVVIATHADQALKLLGDADETERTLLGAFRYTGNEAVLHSDERFMPRRREAWSAWNYLGERAGTNEASRPLCVTYWMNRLQGLDPQYPLFVTLNPTREIAPEKFIRSFSYDHPLFNGAAIYAQDELWRLQGNRSTYFAGSYFGHGFHEDALQAGLAAAESVGDVRRPWNVPGESNRITLAPQLEAAE